MKAEIGYVVLYLKDTQAGAKFWTDNFDFIIKKEVEVGEFKVITVGTKTGTTNFELVPLGLMEDNPHGLNLAIPSICLRVDNLEQTYAELKSKGVEVSPIEDHGGMLTFAVIDSESNAYAVLEG